MPAATEITQALRTADEWPVWISQVNARLLAIDCRDYIFESPTHGTHARGSLDVYRKRGGKALGQMPRAYIERCRVWLAGSPARAGAGSVGRRDTLRMRVVFWACTAGAGSARL